MNSRPIEGAGNAGRPLRPQPRVQNNKAHEQVTTVTPERPGIPYAMVLTVSFVLSRVTGLVCHPRWTELPPCDLMPASGHQDHTTSPSASARFVTRAIWRPPHPVPDVRDDREPPLTGNGTGRTGH